MRIEVLLGKWVPSLAKLQCSAAIRCNEELKEMVSCKTCESDPMDIEIEIAGEKSVIRDVPETAWEALEPFWPPIVKAIIEVFLQGNFKPYGVRKNKKDGFYAEEWYWDRCLINPEEYPLEEAKRFLKMLMKKEEFIESIRKFNEQRKANWTSKEIWTQTDTEKCL